MSNQTDTAQLLEDLKTLNSILWEAIGCDGAFPGPKMPGTLVECDITLPLLLAIKNNDERELGRLIMKYARSYLLRVTPMYDLDLDSLLKVTGKQVLTELPKVKSGVIHAQCEQVSS